MANFIYHPGIKTTKRPKGFYKRCEKHNWWYELPKGFCEKCKEDNERNV